MTTHQQNTASGEYFAGKKGRVYVARQGTLRVILLENGESWFSNTLTPSAVEHRGPVPEYWQHSIDWACDFATYFALGLMYDEEDKPHYPGASDITPEHIEKLKAVSAARMKK